MSRTTIHLAAALIAALVAAGCGGNDKAADTPAVHVGAVVYRDTFDDNRGRWLEGSRDGMTLGLRGDGTLVWSGLEPGQNPSGTLDTPFDEPAPLLSRPTIPEGLAVSASVEMRKGAALRVVYCRAQGPRDAPPRAWYEFGIDGRQAMIRKMSITAPPKVLARAEQIVPNGRRVRVTAYCVPDGDGKLVLVLRLDGREVARATEAKPLPPATKGLYATSGLHAYPRPDTPVPASLAWDDFEVRRAAIT
jgi:hypothetical protein